MTNLVVGSFKNEAQAIAASHKLSDLDSYGDITLYENAMVKKDANGDASIVQSDDSGGLRTLSGMAIGSIVGIIGGPVGVVIGMVTGTLAGAVAEADYIDFSDDFIDKVSNRLQPGSVAVIAEVYEDSPDFVDRAFGSFGATTIFRSGVDYIYDDYVDEQVKETDEEIVAERAKIKSANAAEKAKVQQKIAALKDKRRKRIAELREKHHAHVELNQATRNEAKRERLTMRINRHQTRITELEEKLKELEH